MSVTLARLNNASGDGAAELLRACCGAERWVTAMVARRPFQSVDDLLAIADEAWSTMSEEDWLEAFAHHPRIGERRGAVAQSARGAAWSAGEQAKVSTAERHTREQLAQINDEYERRFGHIYIVCASGKSAQQLLAIARERLANDPRAELRVAAEEQRKIMRLRLRKLFEDPT